MHEPHLRSPTVREREIDIEAHQGVVRWKVYEPRPFAAMRVSAEVAKVLGPTLVQILAGRVRLPDAKGGVCPRCGSTEHVTRVQNEQYLCKRRTDHGDLCGEEWPVTWLVDQRGVPLVLTWGLAMGSEDWRQKIAVSITEQLQKLDTDGDAVERLVCGLLVGASAVRYSQALAGGPGGGWVEMTSKEQLEDNIAQTRDGLGAMVQLVALALETWVLPTLGGGRAGSRPAGTSPDTTASATPGGSSPSAAGKPGRAAPRTSRRRG